MHDSMGSLSKTLVELWKPIVWDLCKSISPETYSPLMLEYDRVLISTLGEELAGSYGASAPEREDGLVLLYHISERYRNRPRIITIPLPDMVDVLGFTKAIERHDAAAKIHSVFWYDRRKVWISFTGGNGMDYRVCLEQIISKPLFYDRKYWLRWFPEGVVIVKETESKYARRARYAQWFQRSNELAVLFLRGVLWAKGFTINRAKISSWSPEKKAFVYDVCTPLSKKKVPKWLRDDLTAAEKSGKDGVRRN